MKTAVIRSRIEPNAKDEADRVLRSMGLTLSDAIRLFLLQVVAEKRLPFVVKAPNAATVAAMEAADRGEVEATSLAQLAHDWEAACAKPSRRRNSKRT
jgi:DNA-damage-inducible protein J